MSEAAAIRLKKGYEEAVRQGMPWIYAGELIESSAMLSIPAGSLVTIENHKGQFIGLGYYNAASPIACRVLTLTREPVDTAFFTRRIGAALAKREAIIGVPYYRLIHSEADSLPGLLIDRFGNVLVAQMGTAGMERLQPLWLEALESLLAPKAIIFRNDTSARKLEGLSALKPSPPGRGLGEGGAANSVSERPPVLQNPHPGPHPEGEGEEVEVCENGFTYYADLRHGQKTGWFYDQRDNRRMIAGLAAGKTLLDMYAHSGGFGLLAAKHGAARVTLADSSKLALSLAKKAAQANSVAENCEFLQGDAFALMEQLYKAGTRFDIVLADPPAFVKSRKDIAAGMRGYEKVARLAASLVEPGGLLFTASCSHHASRPRFEQAVLAGIAKAGRRANIIKRTGAAPDHPLHPKLAQSEYLKGVLLAMN